VARAYKNFVTLARTWRGQCLGPQSGTYTASPSAFRESPARPPGQGGRQFVVVCVLYPPPGHPPTHGRARASRAALDACLYACIKIPTQTSPRSDRAASFREHGAFPCTPTGNPSDSYRPDFWCGCRTQPVAFGDRRFLNPAIGKLVVCFLLEYDSLGRYPNCCHGTATESKTCGTKIRQFQTRYQFHK